MSSNFFNSNSISWTEVNVNKMRIVLTIFFLNLSCLFESLVTKKNLIFSCLRFQHQYEGRLILYKTNLVAVDLPTRQKIVSNLIFSPISKEQCIPGEGGRKRERERKNEACLGSLKLSRWIRKEVEQHSGWLKLSLYLELLSLSLSLSLKGFHEPMKSYTENMQSLNSEKSIIKIQ